MSIQLKQALETLRKGQLIVYPTDTLYALGADAYNQDAIEAVFRLKRRPFSLPLPVAVGTIEQIKEIAVLTPLAKKIITYFLPGSLTIVVEKKSVLPDLLTGNKKTVAIRIPNDVIALELVKAFGPLTVTSANIHKEKTLYSVDEIQTIFSPGDVSYYIDDGPRSAQPSTIIDCTKVPPKILREGSISLDDIVSKV